MILRKFDDMLKSFLLINKLFLKVVESQMKVFQNKLRSQLTTKSLVSSQSARFSAQADFVRRWNKINQEALLGGGIARINKQHA